MLANRERGGGIQYGWSFKEFKPDHRPPTRVYLLDIFAPVTGIVAPVRHQSPLWLQSEAVASASLNKRPMIAQQWNDLCYENLPGFRLSLSAFSEFLFRTICLCCTKNLNFRWSINLILLFFLCNMRLIAHLNDVLGYCWRT